jgi:release factor glutamine methyltransferase
VADLGALLKEAAGQLARAGVASARAESEIIFAHVLGTTRGDVAAMALRGQEVGPEEFRGLSDLVARRVQRVPLQHLLGVAPFRQLELSVGPGVFVPRPETETTAGLAIDAARRVSLTGRRPVVVDLCTGSGAIALAVATEVPRAVVHAVELDPAAHAWAQRNLDGSGVHLVLGDAADALPELDGEVDVVVANPPYIPPGAVPHELEVRLHDPEMALYGGGPDGLDVPRLVVARAERLLRPGGVVVMEHAEVQQHGVLALFSGPEWRAADDHRDLNGRPRTATARRASAESQR